MSDDDPALNLDVGGRDPVANLRQLLDGYDLDDVVRVNIRVFEADEAPDPDDDPGGDAQTNGSNGRQLKGIEQHTVHHLVLAALEQADEPVSSKALTDLMGHHDPNHVSAGLSKLFKRRLVNREDGTRPYTYQVNAHGEAELDRLGRDVTPADVGGVWDE